MTVGPRATPRGGRNASLKTGPPIHNPKGCIRLLVILSKQDPVEPEEATRWANKDVLEQMLDGRETGQDPTVRRYPKGEIEEPLFAALQRITDLPAAVRDLEIRDEEGRLVTVPHFAWENVKLAVYCDGFAVHGNPDTLELDARKRNFLQERGWVVLTYWGRTILKDPDTCARQIAEVYRQRRPQREA